jgi:hypothetical protein
MSETFERHLTPAEAGEILRRTPAALRRWRTEGRGPSFISTGRGRVLYPEHGVREWLAANMTRPAGTQQKAA